MTVDDSPHPALNEVEYNDVLMMNRLKKEQKKARLKKKKIKQTS